MYRCAVCIISVLCLEVCAMQVFTGAVHVYIYIMKESKDTASWDEVKRKKTKRTERINEKKKTHKPIKLIVTVHHLSSRDRQSL